MLHDQARTRLILSELTSPIDLLFSIRQGDPIAMLLYIVYVEPLLATLEVEMAGLRIRNHQSLGLNPTLDFDQKCEAFCDDVNLMTGDLNDLPIIESVIDKFERSSGAILSRNHKCKVIGFGAWQNRLSWPVKWLLPVKKLKFLVFFLPTRIVN